MKILVLMHVPSEGPGTLGDYLLSRGAQLETRRLHAGDPLPADASAFAAIVSMGGPMNVYEENRYPFLKEETTFLERAFPRNVPIIGICLGAQMIAKACGAVIGKAPVKEVGWREVRLTDAGRVDPLFSGVPERLEVFQWHEDAFDIPADGELLVTAAACPHQAFRFRNAYGLQFHVEATRDMLKEWFSDSADQKAMLDRYDKIGPALAHSAERIYANFFEMIEASARNR